VKQGKRHASNGREKRAQQRGKGAYFKTCPKNSDEENVPALRLCMYREKLARQIAVDHMP
jgi:hypothetical protein